MSLHIVPLCSLKYTEGICSSATLKYDTTTGISKDNPRYLYTESNPIDIPLIKKALYSKTNDIDKFPVNKSFYSERNISILSGRCIESLPRRININDSKGLVSIGKSLVKPTFRKLKPSIEHRIIKSLGLEMQNTLNISITIDKNTQSLQILNRLGLVKSLGIFLNRKNLDINRANSRLLDINYQRELYKDIFRTYVSKETFKFLNIIKLPLLLCGQTKGLDISFSHDVECSNIPLISIDLRSLLFKNLGIRKIDLKIPNLYLKLYYKDIDLLESPRLFIRNSLKPMDKDNSFVLMNKITTNIEVYTMVQLLYRESIYNISRNPKPLLLYRNSIRGLLRNQEVSYFYRISLESITKFLDSRGLRKITLVKLLKGRSSYNITRVALNKVLLSRRKYSMDLVAIRPLIRTLKYIALNKITIADVLKPVVKPLNKDIIYNLYKTFEISMESLKLSNMLKNTNLRLLGSLITMNLNKSYTKNLLKPLDLGIVKPNHNKWIDITKRWWWLTSTEPRDRIIIPNKDYSYSVNQLDNNYEYLRFNNDFPIPYGQDWGVDLMIPPQPVSIEIMLDLVNIITSWWHKSSSALMCATGREAIQFLMEILYDWYTMETSQPNTDYYRAFRWVRWEAEKTYFLCKDNTSIRGLQAMGILVANLIDYLKAHHFDMVPLWRKPRAMDIERQFNHIATNGDLMKELDKLKGKRHYFIETKNIYKKGWYKWP